MTSIIKVDDVQNQPGTNIINKCGTDITLGQSGDTIALASGASQTGFGRTGTVDWVTTVKTGDFTAVSGNGYFIDTTSGGVTMTLPSSPSAGDIVSCKDYAYTFGTNALTVGLNGSKIGGGGDFNPTYETNGGFLTFIYIDGTQGWLVTDESNNTTEATDTYIVATGGNQPTAGGCIVDTNYKIHKFTGPGTLCVSVGAGPVAVVDYVVVAGGGAGGTKRGAGGGAGGYRESKVVATSGCWAASPLAAATSLTITATGGPYPISVGGGGTAGVANTPACIVACSPNTSGSNSSISSITSAGGGAGGGTGTPTGGGVTGGSGGGGFLGSPSFPAPNSNPGGVGNYPVVSPAQGTDGGTSPAPPNPPGQAGGGGGAICGGGPAVCGGSPSATNGQGGDGATSSIDGTPTARAGGGGGAGRPSAYQGTAGAGGGGGGANNAPNPWGNNEDGEPGTINTGGGGGGTADIAGASSGGGGSGVVIIRYKFQ